MITAFRRYLETWYARAFFMIMVFAFVIWGVGDVVRLIGTSTWVAKVGGRTIEAQTLMGEYQRDIAAATRELPAGQEASADLRRRVGETALQRLIGQAALAIELRDLRIVTADKAVAEVARDMPAFRGSDGKFSKPVFDTVLRNNGLTEARFLDMLRSDVSQRQLLGAVAAGASAPDVLVEPLYEAQYEKRSADMAEFPLAAAPAPAEPDQAALHRWYDNHPDSYASPEYRRIKAIELSPRTLAPEITVTEDDLKAWYDQHRTEFVTTAKRSSQVISVSDEAKAKALAEQWRGGAGWATMQKAAAGQGAGAVTFDDAVPSQFPDPDLAKAVFAAPADTVSDPVRGALGWFVIKVTKATAGQDKTLEEVKDTVRSRVIADKAADLMYDRANKVDNLLANGTSLDEMPADLGLAGVSGTLDSDGNAMDGSKAPIPGAPELKAAIIKAAFQAQKGDPPRLTEVQTPSLGGSAYYALSVEDVTPSAPRPYDEVAQKVKEDWTFDQQRKEQERAAAQMLAAIKGGRSFSDAATIAGVTPHITPLVTRDQTAEGVPAELQRVLFQLKPGEPTMQETADAFIVAVPAEIIDPDPKADQAGYDQVRKAIAQSVGQDLSSVFAEALRLRANPRVDQKNVDQIIQP
jgi:peptidyl-prolyl cis-trans isomerase D